MNSTMRTYLVLASILIAFCLGLGAGWKLWRPTPLPPSATQPKPAETLPDGGYVPAQHQDHHAQPQQDTPHGSVVDHQGTIVVQPTDPSASGAVTVPTTGSDQQGAPHHPLILPCAPCPQVTIKWSLVTEQDGAQRLVFKADGGKIIGGEDVVIRPPQPSAPALVWSAGVKRYMREKTFGVWVNRQLGPFIIGAEIKQIRSEFGSGRVSADGAVSLGIRF